MTTLVAILAALATICAAGFGVIALLAPQAALGRIETAALSWLIGSGAVSLLLWLVGMAITGVMLQTTVTLLCVVLGIGGYLGRSRNDTRRASMRKFDPAALVLSVVLGCEIALVFYVSLKHGLGWDGLFNWEVKARYAFLNGGSLPAAYMQSSGLTFTHPDYPLWLPFTELWLYVWIGQPNQFWVKLVPPTFYAAGAILLATCTARITDKRWLGLATASSMFLVPQFVMKVGSATGYADMPLALAFVTAIGFLLRAVRGERGCFALYAVMLMLLPWIKREGALLWAIAGICGAVVVWRCRLPRRKYVWLLPGVAVILAWHGFLVVAGTRTSPEFLPITIENLRSNVDRCGPICRAALAQCSDLHLWGLLWFAIAASCVASICRVRDTAVIVLFTALGAPIALYLCAYVFSSWPDYHQHIGLSLPRLLMHVAPIGMVLTALVFSPVALKPSAEADLAAVEGE